jgi:hypothetical protein
MSDYCKRNRFSSKKYLGDMRGEDFFQTVANQKQELPLAAIFVGGKERNGETL